MAVFDGVDVRSEGLVDQFVSTFQQVNLNFEHRFNDNFSMNSHAGRSTRDGKARCASRPSWTPSTSTTSRSTSAAAAKRRPIGFGSRRLGSANFVYGPPLADGNQRCWAASRRRASHPRTSPPSTPSSCHGDWQMTEMFGLKVGAQYRENDFDSHVSNLAPAFAPVTGATGGHDAGRHHDADQRIWTTSSARERRRAGWRSISRTWRDVVQLRQLPDFCNVECGANKSGLLEEVTQRLCHVHFQFGRCTGECRSAATSACVTSRPTSTRWVTSRFRARWAPRIRTWANGQRSRDRTTTTLCRRSTWWPNSPRTC